MSAGMLSTVREFLDRVFSRLQDSGVDVQDFEMDHLCYRVRSPEEYAPAKKAFSRIAALLHEAEIQGRPIATFKLHQPIDYRDKQVSCIELPAPKAGKTFSTGWEHVEFVISESFESFVRRHPGLRLDLSGVKKPHNPEIELSFGDCAVKFHHVALEEAIRRELVSSQSPSEK